MTPFSIALGFALVLVTALYISLLIRIRQRTTIFEYQRGLLYRQGRFVRVLEPGSYFFLSTHTTVSTIDIRPALTTLGSQEILTADGVSLKISLTAQYAIVDPVRAIHENQNYYDALYLALQLALRDAVVERTSERVLVERRQISEAVQAAVAPQASALGLNLSQVQLRDIVLPGDLKRAYAQIVTTQKEGQAALEKARAESTALRHLANTARLLDNNPSLVQLRVLLALSQSAGSSVVFHASTPGPQPMRGPSEPDAVV